MQAVGIGTEIVGSLFLPARLSELHGIKFIPPAPMEVVVGERLFRSVAFRVGKACQPQSLMVPSGVPLR